MTKTMLLLKSTNENGLSFNMIPLSLDCPYSEVVFRNDYKALSIISKIEQDIFKMLPKLNDNGEKETCKQTKKNGSPYKEQRMQFRTFVEYAVFDRQDIIDFIKMFAINADTFDYTAILDYVAPVPETANNLKKVEATAE